MGSQGKETPSDGNSRLQSAKSSSVGASEGSNKVRDNVKTGVLAAAPRRVPLRVGGSVAAIPRSAIPPMKDNGDRTGNSQLQGASSMQQDLLLGHDLLARKSTISDRVKATSSNMDGIVPFFEWRSESANGEGMNAELLRGDAAGAPPRASSTTVSSGHTYMDSQNPLVFKSATSILRLIDEHLPGGKDFDPSTFPVRSDEYDKIEEKRHSDVLTLLKLEEKAIRALGEEERQEGAWEFLESKNKLFLNTQLLLKYFVYDDKHSEKLIVKTWGIVHALCGLGQEQVKI